MTAIPKASDPLQLPESSPRVNVQSFPPLYDKEICSGLLARNGSATSVLCQGVSGLNAPVSLQRLLRNPHRHAELRLYVSENLRVWVLGEERVDLFLDLDALVAQGAGWRGLCHDGSKSAAVASEAGR